MLDRDALLRAIAANHRIWFRRAAGARVERIDGIELVVNGREGAIPFPTRPTRTAVAGVVERATELRLRTVSCWSLTEDKPLGTLLIARGFEWGWQPWWMALELEQLAAEKPRHRVLHRRRGSLHVFAVLHDGRAIGGVAVNPWRRIAGIYDMGVRPEHRRRGVGRSLTLAACGMARDAGCTHAVLNATPEGELLYRSVGFRRLGEGRTWWRHPGERITPRQRTLVEAIGFGDLHALEALRPTRLELERSIGGAGPPLVITALTDQPTVAEWILARRPDLTSRGLGDVGYTLLHAAAEWDAPEVAAVALAHGADTTIRDGTHKGTPLGWAEHFGRERIAAMLR
ncbi:MAG: GNAT family N-acetyltransferase [Solirubrobacterales bacterium]|nr:GNAT family N-acetyltransferase [Solirubrobacterales bacterium]